MKMRILYSLFFFSGAAILFWSASGGPAEIQNRDRTMSPLSGNSSCATCHNNGPFNPTLNVQLLDGEVAVSTYEPGKTYNLSVTIDGAAAATAWGFQAVFLTGEADANAGTFGTPGAGIQVTDLDNRMYAEQSEASTENTFAIEWTAPASGTGNVRLYVGGNAGNGNGSAAGDNGVFLADPLAIAEAGTSNTNDRILSFDALEIAPNPTTNGVMLSLDNSKPGRYTMSIFNAVGQTLQTQNLNLVQGNQTQWIDLADQPKGIYFLRLSNGQQLVTRKILKQ